MLLPVNVSPVADVENADDTYYVFDLVDNTVLAAKAGSASLESLTRQRQTGKPADLLDAL